MHAYIRTFIGRLALLKQVMTFLDLDVLDGTCQELHKAVIQSGKERMGGQILFN
jgi:hypothetical protein